MKKYILLSIALIFLVVTISTSQSKGFIYGTVTTWDDKTFTGQIRWGKEEAFWTDMFNASKIENEFIDKLSRDDFDRLTESRANGSWWNGQNWNVGKMKFRFTGGDDFTHQFNCQFGNLKSIDAKSSSKVVVELKDGTMIRLSGKGYNDIGTKVKVYVSDMGKIELPWDDIQKIDFKDAPSGFASSIGAPLYGKVESWDGTYEGLIQWDKDERVGSDILDGENDGRDMEIEFGNIVSLRKRGRGTEVTLKNGQSYWLEDSNDVDDGNRGIVVTKPGKGRVVIDWDDFEQLTFMDAPSNLKGYSDFGSPQYLKGTVTLIDGKSLGGEIVFDLDEAYTFEILNGEKGDTEFEIPFHDISKIRPRTSGKSIVELKTGDELSLEGSQDVSNRNTGILLFENGEKDPVYITWDEVEEIVFE